MKQSPFFSGILYISLGVLFTYFAINNISADGSWSFFTYLLIILATFDFGSGIKMVAIHFKIKSIQNKK
ncbi:YdiK family protein [Bacillus sp. 03113]|uniref:YdiK family protein n=1 Tax=Bacillus sp. 03113 TaxID=2578211 RepID=UPI001141E470|nr:YdiK family protein [Bacillus sp. 03113]